MLDRAWFLDRPFDQPSCALAEADWAKKNLVGFGYGGVYWWNVHGS